MQTRATARPLLLVLFAFAFWGLCSSFFLFSGRVPQRLPLIYWGFFTTCQILAFQSWVFVLVDYRRFWFPRGEVPGLPISDSMLETLLFQVKWAMETVDFGPEDALGQGWDSSQFPLLYWGGVLLVCLGKGAKCTMIVKCWYRGSSCFVFIESELINR